MAVTAGSGGPGRRLLVSFYDLRDDCQARGRKRPPVAALAGVQTTGNGVRDLLEPETAWGTAFPVYRPILAGPAAPSSHDLRLPVLPGRHTRHGEMSMSPPDERPLREEIRMEGRADGEDDATVTFSRVAPLWKHSLVPGTDSLATQRGCAAPDGEAPAIRLGVRGVAAADAPAPGPGEIPPDYRLIGPIGAGGMGHIHAARQAALDRLIAIKTIHQGAVDDVAQRQRFIAEARVTGGLQHPNIVPLIELAQDQAGRVFFSMRRVEGKPWNTAIGALPLDENLDILLKVCDAVAYAHSCGVIHRDLKPENVMIGDYGEVLVMDWGLAVRVAVDGFAIDLDHQTAIAGTPAYLAPEMALGQPQRIGVRSDVYLLGAILYQIITGAPPHVGEGVMDCLRAAAHNRIGDFPVGEYARIARTALSTRPEDRHATIKAFQHDLRACATHAQSLAVADHADLILAKAERSSDYAGFARAVFGFEEALRLWEGNSEARAGALRAKRAYAACALGRGDLDLAAAQLDPREPSYADLLERLICERAARAAAEAATSRLTEVQARIAAETSREWRLVFEDDFSDPAIERRWTMLGCRWQHQPGELRVWGGQPAVLLLKQPVVGDVRIEFECWQPGPLLNDVSCFLGAQPDADPVKVLESACQVKYGGYDNTRIQVLRPGIVLWDEHRSPLAAGRVYQVRVERSGGRVRLEVDGAEVCDVLDGAPLPGNERGGIGLLGWVAEVRYRAVRVYLLGAPLKADLLETAQRHLALNHYSTAVDLFADVLATAGDPARRESAENGLRRAQLLRDLHRALPGIQARLAACWPRAQVMVCDHGLRVECGYAGIDDLSPLRGLPVRELDCGHNRIADLAPLQGMALTRLNCESNRIRDLAPLQGMPLRILHLFGNQVDDLAPLRGAPLGILHCNGNRIRDLAPLTGMPLTELNCDFNPIADLSPLRGMPLQILSVNVTAITDLSSLAGMPLNTLQMNHCRISDLSPLRGAPLAVVEGCGNRISDLSPLHGAPLNRAWFCRNRIGDLSPLRGAPLVLLDVCHNPLATIAPLLEQPPATFLYDGEQVPESAYHEAIAAWSTAQHGIHRRNAEICLALRRGDPAALRAMAGRHGAASRLFIPRSLEWDEAAALCARLGGRLPVIVDEAGQAGVAEALCGHDAWIGLRRREHREAWCDGSAVTFTAWRGEFAQGGYYGDAYMTVGGRWALNLAEHRWLMPFVIEWPDA
jgi:hypothetical protein